MVNNPLILRCSQPPGDCLMLSAALRDLHRKYPSRFLTDVRTLSPEIWDNNPYVTPLSEGEGVELIDCHYPLINKSDRTPYHFLHGFIDFLNSRLGLAIRPTEFKGDIHLSQSEKTCPSQIEVLTGSDLPFWLVGAGGKFDFTIKWWDAERFQRVIDHFKDKVLFVQVGAERDHHPPMKGVIDLRGKTSLRELIRLVHHAQGVLCPVTLLMHLAAAVETRRGRPKNRACVVIAGGREPMHWTAYPQHQFLHTGGVLKCCEQGGCWRSRTVPLRDGDIKDKPDQLCVDVIMHRGDERRAIGSGADARLASPAEDVVYLPHCMDLITADEVIRRIDLYFDGGQIRYLTEVEGRIGAAAVQGKRLSTAQPIYNGIASDTGTEGTMAPAVGSTMNERRAALERCVAGEFPFPEARFSGRGIVICGGGEKYFPCAWVCINLVRHLGCNLPIELWYLGEAEMTQRMREIVAPLGVKCIDAGAIRDEKGARPLQGWEVKPYAIINSSFEEVLFLDADNVPVRNPNFLFDTVGYLQTGALFWPDIRKLGRHRPIWAICGIEYRDEWEWESGQIVVDKRRCWKALNVAMHFNEESDFYYQHFLGDKESFHLAWRKLGQACVLPERAADWHFDVLLQYDHEGQLLFQHRNGHKWRRGTENDRVPGFLHEERCLSYLEELEGLCGTEICAVNRWLGGERNTREMEVAEKLLGTEHRLSVDGGDFRTIQLGRSGKFSRGGSSTEVYWDLREANGRLMLEVSSNEKATFQLRPGKDGIWRGTKFEDRNCAIELVPQPPEIGLPPIRSTRRGRASTPSVSAASKNGAATSPISFARAFPRIIHLLAPNERTAEDWLGKHPNWEVRKWSEEEAGALLGVEYMGPKACIEVLLKYAIVSAHGGVCVASQSRPLKGLDSLIGMVGTDCFAGCTETSGRYENAVSDNIVGSLPAASFTRKVIRTILAEPSTSDVQPTDLLTRLAANDQSVTIFPRHIFSPAPAEYSIAFVAPFSGSQQIISAGDFTDPVPVASTSFQEYWSTVGEERVLASAIDTEWLNIIPILRDDQVDRYATEPSNEERAVVDSYFEIDRIENPRPARHVISTSLFWKHVDIWQPDLPTPTLEIFKNAVSLGLVQRFDPWSHYLQPLIRGAARLAKARPWVTVRVYLASDLQFLVPMLAKHCEVRVMKHPSLRAQPGMLWRYLAIEDGAEVVSVIDSDTLERDWENIVRLGERLKSERYATWRNINEVEVDAGGLFVYRPITGAAFGTKVPLPAARLLKGFTWHHLKQRFDSTMEHPTLGRLPHFLHPWPGYNLDEWFLSTTVYPRLLPFGFGTIGDGKEEGIKSIDLRLSGQLAGSRRPSNAASTPL